MKESETFYWKNENGKIEEHHISEFRDFLDKGEGHCVTGMEYKQAKEPPTESSRPDRVVAGYILLPRSRAEEKEVV